MKISDADFCAWLRDTKKLTAKDFLKQIETLSQNSTMPREEFKKMIQDNSKGEIIRLDTFSTRFSPNCAVAIEKKNGAIFNYHKLLFITYKTELSEPLKIAEIPYIMSENAAISPRSARKKLINLEADRIKKWLSESYKPAVALHSLFFVFDRRGVFFWYLFYQTFFWK